MSRLFLFLFFLIILSSCRKNQNLLGDWEARDSSTTYAEFAIYDNHIQIYSKLAGILFPWDYSIVNDSLHTPNLNYKIDWIKKDSLVLRNENFVIQLRRINGGACLSEVEGPPENNQKFMDSFYGRSGAK